MNKTERMTMVKAMEFIARNLNDEDIFAGWLVDGVADGDVEYGNVAANSNDDDNLEYYIEDENFADLMDTFLQLMKAAYKSGGLYCDGVVSKPA